MDTSTLVDAQIDDGRKLIGLLTSKDFDVTRRLLGQDQRGRHLVALHRE